MIVVVKLRKYDDIYILNHMTLEPGHHKCKDQFHLNQLRLSKGELRERRVIWFDLHARL